MVVGAAAVAMLAERTMFFAFDWHVGCEDRRYNIDIGWNSSQSTFFWFVTDSIKPTSVKGSKPDNSESLRSSVNSFSKNHNFNFR